MEEKPLGQALLICKDTGKQVKLNLATPIKPWPTPNFGGWIDEEPSCPEFTIEFTIKKKCPGFWLFNRFVYGWRKLPRKMKKAYKHIKREDPVTVVKRQGKYTIFGGIYYYTIDGYPYTKWVRKVIRKASYKEQTSKRITLEKAIENVLKGE